jgi:hypothetical protein
MGVRGYVEDDGSALISDTNEFPVGFGINKRVKMSPVDPDSVSKESKWGHS